ncbi:hypothetical protein MMC17_003627 [Xylographa soralifera]|nr:hypothetical protein [Xylographa soralifera]
MSEPSTLAAGELEGGEEKALPPTQYEFDSVDEKVLLKKIDFRVLPMLFIIYIMAFLDRVNISNALTMNLPKDLNLIGTQENIALTIFFVPYVLFEIPSNILLKKFKPHIWLSGCILAFGIIMLAQGFVHSYQGLLATRFLLGLAECGIFPGSFYLLSFWYKREEAQKRFTWYWCSVLVSSAFGGLLASAIANMNGVGGLSNWRWIFILEGIITILVGIVAFFLVADFPRDAKWLTENERNVVLARTSKSGSLLEKITAKDIVHFFSDFKNILGGVIYFSMIVPIYSFAYFAPTIIKTFGYSTVQTQLHTVPPVAAALGLALTVAYLSDRTRLRSPYIMLCLVLTTTGLAMLISVHNSFSVEYGGLCLIAMGAYAAGPMVICWYVMNLHGHAQRSIGTAWLIGFGNTGGIVATFAFLSTDAPRYTKGYTACLAVTAVGILAVMAYGFLVWLENKRLKATSKEEEEEVNYYSL